MKSSLKVLPALSVLVASCGDDPAFVQNAGQQDLVLAEKAGKDPSSEDELGSRKRGLGEVQKEGMLETHDSREGAPDHIADEGAEKLKSGSVPGSEDTIRSWAEIGTEDLQGNGGTGGREGSGSSQSTGGTPSSTSTTTASLNGMVVAVASTPGKLEKVTVTGEQKPGKVDVLWVIDDSASMRWAQLKLASQFQTFASALQNAAVDFQVGVTSVDMCQMSASGPYNDPDAYRIADELCPLKEHIRLANVTTWSDGTQSAEGPLRGRLKTGQDGAAILTNTPDFVKKFAALAQLGVSGSRYEHGLKAARESVLLGKQNGFVRPDAFLSVIVLSDEEDDSIQFWCEDAWGNTTRDASGQKDIARCTSKYRYSSAVPNVSSPFKDQFELNSYALFGPSGSSTPYTTWKYTADQFVTELSESSVKGPGKFRVSAITGIADEKGQISCNLSAADQELAALALQGQYVGLNPAPEKPYEVGTNYIKAAGLTGGQIENICSSDWNAILANIGKNIAEQASQIALPAGKIPELATLVVQVDRDADGTFETLSPADYVYVAQSNTVALRAVLPQKTKIRIEFQAKGAPVMNAQ